MSTIDLAGTYCLMFPIENKEYGFKVLKGQVYQNRYTVVFNTGVNAADACIYIYTGGQFIYS